MTADAFKIQFEVEIGHDRLSDVVSTAFEGGISYWCIWANAGKIAHGKTKDDFEYRHQIATTEGCSVIVAVEDEWEPKGELWGGSADDPAEKHIHDPDNGKYEVGLPELKKALQLMAVEDSKHFADILADDYDADTGDVLIQYACFGKVIYG